MFTTCRQFESSITNLVLLSSFNLNTDFFIISIYYDMYAKKKLIYWEQKGMIPYFTSFFTDF